MTLVTLAIAGRTNWGSAREVPGPVPVRAHRYSGSSRCSRRAVFAARLGVKPQLVSLQRPCSELPPVVPTEHTPKNHVKKPAAFNSGTDALAFLRGSFIPKLVHGQHISLEGVRAHTLGRCSVRDKAPFSWGEDHTQDHREQEQTHRARVSFPTGVGSALEELSPNPGLASCGTPCLQHRPASLCVKWHYLSLSPGDSLDSGLELPFLCSMAIYQYLFKLFLIACENKLEIVTHTARVKMKMKWHPWKCQVHIRHSIFYL